MPLVLSGGGGLSAPALIGGPIPKKATQAALQLGGGSFSGGSGSFNGSAQGTGIGINPPATFTGDLVNFQIAGGASLFKIDYTGAVTATSFSGTVTATAPFTITGTPPANANNAAFQAGGGVFGGGAGTFAGSASGTVFGANVPNTFAGNFVDLQLAGTSGLQITAAGSVLLLAGANVDTISAGAINNALNTATQYNIGKSGKQFQLVTGTGAVTIQAGGLTVSAGGYAVTGNSTLAGSLTLSGASGSVLVPATQGIDTSAAGQLRLGYSNATSMIARTGFQISAIGSGTGAFLVGPNDNATNPTLSINTAAVNGVTGILIANAAAGSGAAISVLSSAAADNLTLDAKGTGTITIAGTSTGAVTISRNTTVAGNASGGAGALAVTNSDSESFVTIISALAANLTANQSGTIQLGQVNSANNLMNLGFLFVGAGSASNAFQITPSGGSVALSVTAAGNTTVTGTLTVNGVSVTGGASLTSMNLSAGNTALNLGTGAITSGAINGQTISSAASLTGTLAVAGAVTVTSSGAAALAVGRQGATNPALNVDASTASVVTGLNIKGAAAGGGLALSVIGGNANENASFGAKGTGNLVLTGGQQTVTLTTAGGVTNEFQIVGDSTGHSFTLQFGRSAVEAQFGVAAGAGAFFSDSGAGDLCMTDQAGTTIRIGSGAASTLRVGTAATILSTSANALAVGANGVTNPALNVDASTASSATGLNIKSAAAAGGLALSVISSGAAENLTVDALGTGTVTIAGTSTGNVRLANQSGVVIGNATAPPAGTFGLAILGYNNTNYVGLRLIQPSTTPTGFVWIGATNNAQTADVGIKVAAGSTTPGTCFLVTANTAASGLALSVISSSANENLTLDAKGTGTITIAGTSTGAVTIGQALGVTGALTVTSSGSAALAVGRQGATNPALNVDASMASSVTGLNIQAGGIGGGLALSVIASSAVENLRIDAKGVGTITLGSVSTGLVISTRNFQAPELITRGDKTSGALTAFTLTAAAQQVDTNVDRYVSGSIVNTSAVSAVSLAIQLSPDNVTYTSVATIQIPSTTVGTFQTPWGVYVPKGWFIKATNLTNATATAGVAY